MKVLVTGGAGYIGVVLIRHLLDRGDEVFCYDNLTGASIVPLLPFFSASDRFHFIRADVRDREPLADGLRGVDAIVHLAGIVGYPACKADPHLNQSVNVDATRLLDQLRGSGQKLIFASTGSVYGSVVDGLCSEEIPAVPLTEYGRAKLEGEQILLDSGNVVVCRFATAFGLSPQLRLDLLINHFCYLAIRERQLILYESQFQRSFLHVTDIARAILHGLDHYDVMKDVIFNCGDESLNASKLEVAQMIKRRSDFYLHLAELGSDEDQRNYRVSYQRLQATGFRASVGLEEGIAEMLAAFPHVDLPNPYSRAV